MSSRAGFQMTAVDDNDSFVGNFMNAGPNSSIGTAGSFSLHEHSPAQNFGGGNTVTFTVDWMSPATGSGDITLYAAAVLGNGSGSSGDGVVTTSTGGMFQGGGGGLITVDVTGNDVPCFGENTGSATANPSGGGGGPYMYAWSNGGNTQTISNLGVGMYTVTVTNGQGGQGTGSVMINQPASPVSVSIISQTNIDCNNPTATATAQGAGGSPGYSYAWSNGSSGPTASFTSGGSFTVTATDANQCEETTNVTITMDVVPPLSEAGTNAEISCTNPTTMLDGSGSSSGPGITYQWTTVNGQIISGANTLFPVVGAVGTYTLTVTDNNNGCNSEDDVEVLGDTTEPTANAGNGMELNCTTSEVDLDGTASSTGANFTYLWSTTNGNIISGETTTTPTVNASGNYTILVTNTVNGCTSEDVVEVTSNVMMPTANAGDNMTLNCDNPSVQLNGNGSSSGNFSYQWSTTNGNILSGGSTLTPTVDEPGTYCLIVTDLTNGCTSTDCADVDEDTTPPIANAGSSSPLTCDQSSVQLDGSASSSGANFTYLWTTTGGNIVSGENTATPTVNQAATYTIIVTNTDNGCTSTDDVIVSEDITPPTADAGPTMALNCNNTTVVLDGSGSSQGGNFSYEWSGPGIQSGGTTLNPTVNAPGTYSLIVTNTSNGCSEENSTTVTESSAVGAAIPTQTNVLCNGAATGSATAEGSGGTGVYTFEWSNSETTATISDLPANTYSVTITDEDGCTETAMTTITEPDELLANASATAESFSGANDGTATAEPEGGTGSYTYEWSNSETTQTITGLSTGNYTVTVTDANNCTTVETVTVASFDCAAFTVSISSNEPNCNGAATGSATAEPSGGTSPFTYAWSNGNMEATANNLEAGTYSVTIFDANDCEIVGNVTLGEPPVLGLMVSSTSSALCNGDANGSASLSANGGTPGYEYEWPDGNTSPDRNDLAAGSYTVSLTDVNGCETTTQVTIDEPSVLMANVTATDETAVGANDGTANAPTMGGTSPFTFLWSNGENSQNIIGLAPGEYCVTVTDANQCTFEGCATVNAFGCGGIATSASATNVSCFGEADGTASVDAQGFTEPINYEWSNGDEAANIGNLIAGMYTVTVSDANGCSAIDMVEVTEPDELTVALGDVSNLECPGDMSGSISVEGEGGTPGYAYSWPNGETTSSISNLEDGTYEVTVTDDNNCESTLSVEVGIDPDTELPVVVTQNITVSLDENGMASILAEEVDGGSTDNCGVAELVIDISDFTCADLGDNEVVLAVADAANNCVSGNAIVTVVDNLPPVLTCPDDIVVNNGSCQAVVDYTDPTAEDNCGTPTVQLESGLASGSTFPSGTTEVVWSADDGNGNTQNCSFNVTIENEFTASAEATSASCFGEADGTATASPTGGAEPFSFMWSDPDGQMTQTATGLSANTYTVTVTDADGCSTIAEVEVGEPLALEVTVDEVTNETGTNMDGAISITVTNGAGDLTYEWILNGTVVSTDEDPTGLSAGEYTLVATDANGCTVETTVIVDMVSSAFDAILAGKISLFPNPASEQVNVRFELPQTMEVSMTLLDLTGRPVLPEFRESLSERTLVLEMNGLSAGVYSLRIVADESVVIKRVIVQ